MRIIAGTLKRRTLKAPKGHLTRPTSNRAREAIFNLLFSRIDLEDADVLDLFSGTGALGFEALSRGARTVTFVEIKPQVLAVSRDNAEQLGVSEDCVFFRSDVMDYLKAYQGPSFDLVLADPPYELDALPDLPDRVLPLLHKEGYFVLEHDRRHSFEGHPSLDTSRSYGRTIVSVFQNKEPLSTPS